MSAEGTARAVKPWSSFQCTGIHRAVRAPTYKGDEHLAYALNKSGFFTFTFCFVFLAACLDGLGPIPLSMRASPIWSLDHETDDKSTIIIIIRKSTRLSLLQLNLLLVYIAIETLLP